MRVLFVSCGYIPSVWAQSIQIMKMAEALAKELPHFRLLTGTGWRETLWKRTNLWQWYGIRRRFPVWQLPIQWRLHLGLDEKSRESPHFRPLLWAARLWRPDAILTRDSTLAYRFAEAGIPVYYETHLIASHPIMPAIVRLSQHPLVKGILTLTERLQRDYSLVGIPRDKIHVLPSGVDLEHYPEERDTHTLRKKLGLALEPFTVVYTGNLNPHKGMQLLLDTALRLPHVQFVIVGGWPHDISFWQEIIDHMGMKNIHLTGFVAHTQIPYYLQASDLCVLPNNPQSKVATVSMPLKLFEYMACGRPLLATRTEFLESFFAKQQEALLAPYSAAAFAEKIELLRRDKALAQRLAQRARQRVQEYTWDRRAHRIQKLLIDTL